MAIVKNHNDQIISVFTNETGEISILSREYLGENESGGVTVLEYTEDIVCIAQNDLDDLIKELLRIKEEING